MVDAHEQTSPADVSLRNALEKTTNQQLDPQTAQPKVIQMSNFLRSDVEPGARRGQHSDLQNSNGHSHGSGYPRTSFSMQCREALGRLSRPDSFFEAVPLQRCCLSPESQRITGHPVEVWYAGVCCHYGLRPDEHGRLFWIVLTWTICTDTKTLRDEMPQIASEPFEVFGTSSTIQDIGGRIRSLAETLEMIWENLQQLSCREFFGNRWNCHVGSCILLQGTYGRPFECQARARGPKIDIMMFHEIQEWRCKPPEVPPMIMLELQGNQGLPPNQGNISRCALPFFFENVSCFCFQ